MANDSCSAVKADLKAGTFTRHTKAFPIYIKDKDKNQGGNVYVRLQDGRRSPIQTVSGTVLITPRSCTIIIHATSDTIRDNIYLDIIDILTATKRGYKIEPNTDMDESTNVLENIMKVSMLL